MYDIYTVLENITLFVCQEIVFKFTLPIIFITLVFSIIGYLFSKESKKEDILELIKKQAIGFTILVFLPFFMLWFITFMGKMSGADIDIDTSILDKLINKKGTTVTMEEVATDSTPVVS